VKGRENQAAGRHGQGQDGPGLGERQAEDMQGPVDGRGYREGPEGRVAADGDEALAQAQPAGLRIELDRADEADHDGRQGDVEDREPFGIGGL